MSETEIPEFPPSREEAVSRLNSFLPHAGRAYASGRNYDPGDWSQQSVSCLSPYLSRRILTEEEVVSSVVEKHGRNQAEKYIQEVCWRTYWKGWLEQRPTVWNDYLDGVSEQRRIWSETSSLQERWQSAEEGQTELASFNHWVKELVTRGYLHNHARMWFAGIWIYEWGLPWQLGADFFYRNLLDRDPASNTLSWRWVAGLQTKGKRYIPSAGNIKKYTGERFDETGVLSCQTDGPDFEEHPERQLPEFPPEGNEPPEILLIHRDDLGLDVPSEWTGNLKQVVLLDIPSRLNEMETADHVKAFDQATLQNAEKHWSSIAPCKRLAYEDISEWWTQHGDETHAMPWSPVGPVRDALESIWKDSDVRPRPLIREWDRNLWPQATAGFFSFWKKVNKKGLLFNFAHSVPFVVSLTVSKASATPATGPRG